MNDPNEQQGPWVIVVGALDPVDATRINLDRFDLDGKPFIPVFGNPEAFRAAMLGRPGADRALKIRLDLLQQILKGDEQIIFDTGEGEPTAMSVTDLRSIATRT